MNVREIFTAARTKPTDVERSAFLDEACSGRADVRAEVEALLREHDQVGSFLEAPASLPHLTKVEPVTEGPGTMIGPYKLMDQIGEGGFGLVFVAEQREPVRRTVALKLIKPGMDTRQVIARFEAERQALAIMDHPNIARVFDAGASDTGRPYFVMELVRGIPITDYCDKHRLTPHERLDVFVSVCHAVQHAHQKGIIHRDIKPSNVLVMSHDGKAVVKVIDFGVAKAVNQQLGDRSIYTHFAQMIGTPMYMSPEQADMSALDIDTRSDIYSLGVLLYELLTGKTPFDKARFGKAAYDEIRRVIREEEPEKPSSRISQSGDTLASVAAQRKMEPTKLSKLVRGDLDWITMKALEKDRTRRYETATGMADDIRRYLTDEPVQARPPSNAYKVRKFARKHRRLLGIAAAFTILLTAATALSVWQALRATSAEHRAELERDIAVAEKARADEQAAMAEAVNAFLNDGLLFQSTPLMSPDRDLKLRTILDRASNQIDGRFADRPIVAARLRRTMGNAYTALGELDAAERHAVRGRELHLRHLGAEDRDTLVASNTLALVWFLQGRFNDARKLFEETIETQSRVLGPEDRDTLRTMINLANLLRDYGQVNEARPLAEKTLALCRRVFGPEALETFAAQNSLATTLTRLNDLEKARELYEHSLPIIRRVLGPEHPYTLTTKANLANVHGFLGRYDAACELYTECLELDRRVLGPEHPDTLLTMYNLATSLDKCGRYGEAIEMYEKALLVQRRVSGETHKDTLNTMNNLGWMLTTAKDPKWRNPQRALELAKDVVKHRPQSGNNWNSLGIAHFRNGEWQPAIEALEKSDRLAPNQYVAHNGFFLAMAHFQRGEKEKAHGWYEKAVKWMEKNAPKDDELRRFRAEAGSFFDM